MYEYCFPNGFLIGTSISAQQTESNLSDDFTDFSLEKTVQHEPRGNAVFHDVFFESDFQLARDLNANCQRLSFAWDKIMPEVHVVDYDALDHYKRVIERLNELGLEPILTIHHFCSPRWFSEKGGWLDKENVNHYLEFVQLLLENFNDSIGYWLTLNEPASLALASYFIGALPPGERSNLEKVGIVQSNLLNAHAKAFQLIHSFDGLGKKNLVSFSNNLEYFEPASRFNPLDWIVSKAIDKIHNFSFLDAVESGILSIPMLSKRFPFFWHKEEIEGLKGSVDFIAVNYFSRVFASFKGLFDLGELDFLKKPNLVYDDLGFELFPEGLEVLLVSLKKYGKPVIVTEFGCADNADKVKPKLLVQYLQAISQAISKGVDVRGALFWSLLDNYEWRGGSKMRFGLYSVDYASMQRKLTFSGELFKQIAFELTCGSKVIPTGILNKYGKLL